MKLQLWVPSRKLHILSPCLLHYRNFMPPIISQQMMKFQKSRLEQHNNAAPVPQKLSLSKAYSGAKLHSQYHPSTADSDIRSHT